uniref:T-cell surface glycoprotein CD3 zeta chain n=1 Tax=Oryzias melastigma TaxID=30732 RepID=A0A3B3DSM0_ORYME
VPKKWRNLAISQPQKNGNRIYLIWLEPEVTALSSSSSSSSSVSSFCLLPEATMLTDPRLCYILDGFLGLYGLIITGMFIKEKPLREQDQGEYKEIRKKDVCFAEACETFVLFFLNMLTKCCVLQRPRKNDQVYQDLSAASRDTYDALHMQPLAAR